MLGTISAPLLGPAAGNRSNMESLLFHHCAIYHIRAKERAKYATLLAAQNEPDFALFTSSDLDFLTDELFTEMDFLTEQTETSE